MTCRPVQAIILSLALLFYGCSAPDLKDADTAEPAPFVEQRFTRGGAPIDVIVGLSSEAIALSEFLTVVVRVEHAEDVQIQPPYLSEAVYDPLLLVETPKEDLRWSEADNRIVKTWSYKFEPMQSGEFQLHPFRVYFRLQSEQNSSEWPVYEIVTSEINYRVTAIDPGEQGDIRDIKGPVPPPFDFVPPVATAAIILIAAIVVWVIGRYRSGKSVANAETEQEVDYYAEALQRLDELEAKDYISQHAYERLHVELSTIMRYFIEHRFHLKALELTTEEFLQEIRYSAHFNSEQQAILRQFLEMTDLVKFATFDPGSSASREAVKTARYFIESTRKADED